MRARSLAPLAVAAVVALALPARADLEGNVLVSERHGVRVELPRGWRTTASSGYPGTLAWLSRSRPRVRIAIAVDAIAADCATGAVFCSHDPAAAAAALRAHLVAAGFEITAQEQTRTPELEYQGRRGFLRHAVIVVGDVVVSVILAADTPADRAAVARTFDRITQSVRPLPAP